MTPSIYDIESSIAGLMEIISDPVTSEEERKVAEAEVIRWIGAELTKVDGIRGFLKHCDLMAGAAKLERDKQAERARIWEARKDRLKQFVLDAMSAFGRKKLEGRTGSLSVRGNGGKQALKIEREDLIPNECKTYSFRLCWEQWRELQFNLSESNSVMRAMLAGLAVAVNEPLVRARLESGEDVPGARLEPRGEHLRCE